MGGSTWLRSVTALVVGVVAVSLSFPIGAAYRHGAEITPFHMTAAFGISAILCWLWLFVFRHTLFDSARYKRYVQAMVTLITLGTYATGFAGMSGVPYGPLIPLLIVCGTGFALSMSMTVDRAFMSSVAVGAVFIPLTLAFPPYVHECLGLALLADSLFVAWHVRPGKVESLDDVEWIDAW